WRVGPAGARLDAIRHAAPRLKETIARDRVKSVRTFDLVTLPYPSSYAFSGAARTLLPFLLITNRMQIVSMETRAGVKRVLVNPSAQQRNQETRFFKRLAGRAPELVQKLIAKRHSTVAARIAEAGLRGEDIDYVTFDHLHTQDVRRLLGEWCPRAQ